MNIEHFQLVLNYCPETGLLTWRERVSKAVKPNDIAGNFTATYVTVGYRGKVYKAHRLAWLLTHGEWPDGLIDHINGDKHDNRLCNLRVVDKTGNSENVRKPNRRNKSGFMGVIFFQNKWRANITIHRKTHWLGDFSTPEEAHQVYIEAKRKHHLCCSI
jgi:hypothetical protein